MQLPSYTKRIRTGIISIYHQLQPATYDNIQNNGHTGYVPSIPPTPGQTARSFPLPVVVFYARFHKKKALLCRAFSLVKILSFHKCMQMQNIDAFMF